MDRRTKLMKEVGRGEGGHRLEGGPGRKIPYLLCPQNKKPEEYSEEERIWMKKREEGRKGHTPVGWWNYFRECVQVKIRDGDSLGLWLSKSVEDGRDNKGSLPFILFLHGGGYSGLTWAPVVDELSRLIEAEYGALDLRGHGESECGDENDLGQDRLTQDVIDAITWMQEDETVRLNKRPLIVIGHSMGGALGVNVCLNLQETDKVKIAGLAVLDVVEGSALLALTSMQIVLKNRPHEFSSLPEAIQWCTKSGQTKNLDSARISMSGQLMQKGTGILATQFLNRNEDGSESICDSPERRRIWEQNGETNHTNNSENNHCSENSVKPFTWRIDLSKTEKHWKGWFEGLSKKFLSVRCPKLLMLAGVDRLDKELTVGQMQGKFQMQVFHQVGHAVHEDVPEKAAECVASFLCRQRITVSKGNVPKALPGC